MAYSKAEPVPRVLLILSLVLAGPALIQPFVHCGYIPPQHRGGYGDDGWYCYPRAGFGVADGSELGVVSQAVVVRSYGGVVSDVSCSESPWRDWWTTGVAASQCNDKLFQCAPGCYDCHHVG